MRNPLPPLHNALKARPRLVRNVILAIVTILAVGVLFFLFLGIYFWFGDDLVIDLRADQTSFSISNTERAPVQVSLVTSGQLFCATACNLTLLNMSANALSSQEALLLKRGSLVERNFSLLPGTAGEGQALYAVAATCTNIPSPLCPTLAPQRRKTLLLTVNYRLPSEDAKAKPLAKQELEAMLVLLRQTDIVLQETNGMISSAPRLNTAAVLAQSAQVQERFYGHKLFLENARLLWMQESYLFLQQLLLESNTTRREMDATLADATALRASVLALAEEHNALRERIEGLRVSVNRTAATYAGVPERARLINPAVDDVNALVAAYGADAPAYSLLRANVTAAQGRAQSVEIALAELNRTLVAQGAAILQTEQALLCARNITCDAPMADDVVSICARMREVRALAENLTNATNATVNDTAGNLTGNATEGALLAEIGPYLDAHCDTAAQLHPIDMTMLARVLITIPNVTSAVQSALPDNPPQCCVFGECAPCCNTAACADDPQTYPVVFVHGHAFNSFNSPEYSLGGYFSGIQQRLQEEGYLDAGIITPSSTLSEVGPGEWGLSGRPVTVRVTYYYNFYRSGDDYKIVAQKSENIETYAIRLKEMVDIAKHHTGKKKVNIVAHSMGGLVVRRYIQMFGEDSVDKIILIGTPNNGISARTRTLCPVFGESKECEDMDAESVFMRKLNDPAGQPASVEVVTITGHGCDVADKDGDGVVTAESVALPFAQNYDIDGTCDDFFGTELHTEMLNVEEFPQTYAIIRDELKK